MRDILIDILHERMDYHKDKFISPIILQELNGLEIKKNRVDHSSTTHDDQIFSMLMALYVWYYGKDIMANFGIRTYNIRTDEDYQESMIDNEKNTLRNPDACADVCGDNGRCGRPETLCIGLLQCREPFRHLP